MASQVIKLAWCERQVAVLLGTSPKQDCPSLGGVASLGPPRPGNPGNRGMEAALGLRAPPTALQGLRLIVLSRVRGGSGPALEEAATWETSLAVLCVYTIQLNWFPSVGVVQCVHCTECTMCTLYGSVYICTLQCVHCNPKLVS